jgi:hypothetical protein
MKIVPLQLLCTLLLACATPAHADMTVDSPAKFPAQGALPAKYPPDRPAKAYDPGEKDYYLFSTPERSLAQIAAIQSAMPAGRFTAPPHDWTHLQRTRRILREGGDLRLLALGDSIVNDTMRSGWVAKLQEAYPKARIEATVYVRGGGGCQHYKEEQRLARNVIPRRPDLVFIGGISQKDIASIREVIRQLRAALPEVEILLATGTFGTADPRDPEALAKAPHSGTGAYGQALKYLAEEENCAYLDMTTPWAEYIRSSKLHPHLFYRDAVHANEYGEQILSRILLAFWAEGPAGGAAADPAGAAPPIAAGPAPSRPLQYSVSWVGNSFSGGSNRWVQNFFVHTQVQPDGTVNTWSHWDEGGKKFGVYKDGDVIGNRDVKANSLEANDKSGHRWKLLVDYVDPKNQEWEFTPKAITCDGQEVRFPELHQPTALALANDGALMVADSLTGPRQQVLFYDISDVQHPKFIKAFGDYGGIGSGKPGEVTPTKFWGIRGLGMDAENNLYVALSEMGTVLRKFTPQGKLAWEIYGHFFVDVACADPATDGRDVWGIQEHYALDYARIPGPGSGSGAISTPDGDPRYHNPPGVSWVGYSLNRRKYPNDPRGLMFVKQQGEHGLTSPQIVYLKGKRFLFVGGMFASNFINIFRYEDETAIPSGLIMQWGNNLFRTEQTWPPNKPKGTFIWRDQNGDGDYQAGEFAPNTERVHPGPFWVDKKGNIWMAYGFFRYDCQGLDDQGNPIYQADKITVLEKPQGVNKVARVCYLDDTDTLVVADEGSDMRHINRVFVCRGYLAGNRQTISFVSGAGKHAACVAAAGDYAFTGGWQARGRIWVNRLGDGAEMGVFEPGQTVGGIENTGWIDILTGLTAFKRADGEYLIFVEEDYKAKSILYRWRAQ